MILVAACLAIQAGGYLLRDSILRVGVYDEPL
jgi:formate-dependent nitrite reductase membrane component NrfD